MIASLLLPRISVSKSPFWKINQFSEFSTFKPFKMSLEWLNLLSHLLTTSGLVYMSFWNILLRYCQARVQVPNPLSQQAQNPNQVYKTQKHNFWTGANAIITHPPHLPTLFSFFCDIQNIRLLVDCLCQAFTLLCFLLCIFEGLIESFISPCKV